MAGCVLCESDGGDLVVRTEKFRVIRTDEGGFPAFYRVIWNDHRAELSDLSADDRNLCLDAVIALEKALIRHLHPSKVNLAALGNAVPHLHWHVIARFDWDSHFPAPVWAAAVRTAPKEHVAKVVAEREAVANAISHAIAALRC